MTLAGRACPARAACDARAAARGCAPPDMEPPHGRDPRHLRPRLPGHVLAAGPGRERPGGARQGDPEQPYTAGFACAKVNRDADLVHSPDAARARRCAAPAPRARASSRRSPGTRRSTRSTTRWKAIIAEHGPLALLGYAYSAHQGQINRRHRQRHVPCAGHQPPARRHGLRQLLRDGVGHDASGPSAAPIPESWSIPT